MTNTCKTCKYREAYGKDFYCVNPKLGESGEVTLDYNDDSLVYSYNEGGSFMVGANFGCVHHKDKNMTKSTYTINGIFHTKDKK